MPGSTTLLIESSEERIVRLLDHLEDIKARSNLTDYFILIGIELPLMKAGKGGGLFVVPRQEMHFMREDWRYEKSIYR